MAVVEFRVRRLGPLRETGLELGGVTLLTGPQAQGKTLVLSALFSELLPANPSLASLCFVERLPPEVLGGGGLLVDADDVHVNDNIIIENLKVCVDKEGLERAKNCARGWLIPENSDYELRVGEKRIDTAELTFLALQASLHGARAAGESRLCYDVGDITIGKSIVGDRAKLFEMLLSLSSDPRSLSVKNLVLAELVNEVLRREREQLTGDLARVRSAIDSIRLAFGNAKNLLSGYRLIYNATGRSLVAVLAFDPSFSADRSRPFMSLVSILKPGTIHVFGMYMGMREGLSLLHSPDRASASRALLELAGPALRGRLAVESDSLYLDLGSGLRVPPRMFHGSALSLSSLVLSALPLADGRGGFFLVDEVEHQLHPSLHAVAAVLLLGLAGLGIRVVASTHSTIVTSVTSRIAQAPPEERPCLVKSLYKALGYEPPGSEALELVKRGAGDARIYVVDSGQAMLVEEPLVWVDKLTDPWYSIASWVASSCGEPDHAR